MTLSPVGRVDAFHLVHAFDWVVGKIRDWCASAGTRVMDMQMKQVVTTNYDDTKIPTQRYEKAMVAWTSVTHQALGLLHDSDISLHT